MDKRASFFSRFIAYVMDLCIVSVIVSIVTIGFGTNTINRLNEEVVDITNRYLEREISDIEYVDEYIGVFYEINRASFDSNLVYLVICVGYFLIFQYLNKGQTIGKRLMKIRIVNKDNSDVGFIQMFVRTGIINEIISMGLLLVVVMLSRGMTFFSLYSIISVIQSLFVIICVFMLLYRKDKLALHDMMSCSMVVRED